ncbi:hypothetical protein WA026_011705 [Henosepilachna vigintioctopunctata]|uniref:Uncharacterized protein n=1 Tax=Henosepilachna vigintioctopunctata TaxID=420089 RepID=A0AAW1UBR5_9CUCU
MCLLKMECHKDLAEFKSAFERQLEKRNCLLDIFPKRNTEKYRGCMVRRNSLKEVNIIRQLKIL